MLGTSDAWPMSRLSHRPSKPAYYIEDCRISISNIMYSLFYILGMVSSLVLDNIQRIKYRHCYKKRIPKDSADETLMLNDHFMFNDPSASNLQTQKIWVVPNKRLISNDHLMSNVNLMSNEQLRFHHRRRYLFYYDKGGFHLYLFPFNFPFNYIAI